CARVYYSNPFAYW
nr:immunoglobulin heavy chain junction region [Mus musculus]NSM06963.1 immunoglobulin heavy chain junction region [Mus musculus]NSM07016.1 immunoglobulin heavy chain junction region [Mus musculus]